MSGRTKLLLGLAVLPAAAATVHLSAAAFTSGSRNAGNALGAHSDWTGPTASASVIAKAAGGMTGYVRQGGSFQVYANVTDSGNPPSGVASVTADVSRIVGGQKAATLSPGSYTIGGASYGYRTDALTADASLPEGTYSYTLSASDAAANTATEGNFTVIVDNTSASASDVQAANVTGGTAGIPEAGDRVTITYSEAIDPASILAGWNGQDTNVVVRISNGGGRSNDSLTLRNPANTAQLPVGSVNLGSKDYVSATREFGASGTPSTMAHTKGMITVTLGTPSGSTGTPPLPGTMSWAPSATATDHAGNASSTTETAESGLLDVDF